VLAFFLFWGFAISAFAQSGGTAGSFSRIGFGPRGMAMGNAFTSVTNDGIYSYYNPAIAAYAPEGNQFDLATSAMSFDRTFSTANATFKLPPVAGITVSILHAGVSDIDGRSGSGYDTGMLDTNEYQLAAAWGRRIGDSFSIGLGFKYYLSDLHTNLSVAKTAGLDLGLLYTFSDRLRAGFTVQDLLASYSWNSSSVYGDESSNQVDKFPTIVRVGISYDITQKWLASLEGGRLIHENISRNNLRIGSSYLLHERITARAGWQIDELSSLDASNHFSAGFSVHLPFDVLSPSVDYAFVQEANNIYMHTFGLRLNL
jgi:hypothetical protein